MGLKTGDKNPNTKTGLSDDLAPVYEKAFGKVGENSRFDEREQDQEILDRKPWDPPHLEDRLEDYTKVQRIPGLSMKKTNERLAEMGLGREVEGRHGDLMAPKDRIGPFKGFVRDVLISARGRYYWVGAGPCPLPTGPNNEISRFEFERVSGL